MSGIKAIQTYYNGNRFRSGLEARWAVFFDALNIKYDYETEGYDLGDGDCYLPDFFLPELGYYVEVKGKNDHMLADMNKVEKFALSNKTVVIILSQVPYSREAGGLYWFPIIYYIGLSGGYTKQCYAFFMTGDGDWLHKGYVQDDFYIRQKRRFFFRPTKWHLEKGISENDFVYESIQAVTGDVLDEEDALFSIRGSFGDLLVDVTTALLKARTARFEHGETPTI